MEKYEIAQDPCFSELLELQRKKQAIEQRIQQRGKEFYEKEKNAREQIIAEKKKALTNAVSVAEIEFDNVMDSLCTAGVHICVSTQIETSNGFIAVTICPFCGKITSATEFVLLRRSHHTGDQYKRREISESEYSQLASKEVLKCKAALYKFNKYLELKEEFEGTDKEVFISVCFMDDYLLEYYEKIDFKNDEIKSLLLNLKKVVEEKEQAHKALADFNEEKETQQLMEELCKTFGHDVVSSAYANKNTTCNCCGKTQDYGGFVKEWDEAPLHDTVFKRPVVKPEPEVRTEIRYRSSDYKSPDDYYYYDD